MAESQKNKQKTILSELMDTVGGNYAYYILFLYLPEYLDPNIKTYTDLCNKYSELKPWIDKESVLKRGLCRKKVQDAIKNLLIRTEDYRDSKLLNKYYELAMKGDTKALKAYMDFKKVYMKEKAKSTNSIYDVSLGESNDEDDNFQMIL